MEISLIETPAAVVDIEVMEANIVRLQNYLNGIGVANRPHIKTHKIPEIAHLQMKHGAVGITCQKLGEAEVMAKAGIRDIFVPYNILGEAKLARLARLMWLAEMSVTADSSVTVSGLSRAAVEAGKTLSVLVELDCGLGRCGVQNPEEAVALALEIEGADGLRFDGLMTYPNSAEADVFVAAVKTQLAKKGMKVGRVSGGGTNCMWDVHKHPEFTEHRAGMYVYGDRYTMKSGAVKPDECAFKVHATIVSRPTADRGILDAGSKSLSSDLLGLEGYGMIVEYPDAKIYALSEEHGNVDFSKCDQKPSIGDRVTVIPNHCCVANNLFNEIVVARQGKVEAIWRIAARGALQ